MRLKNFHRRLFIEAFSLAPLSKPKASSEPIDIVIPVTIKDLGILSLCLEGIRNCVANQIRSIFLVSPESEEIMNFCNINNCYYINETSVLGINTADISLFLNDGSDRSGWLFQQLLKLSGKIGTCENYLCIDADHVLLKPHIFLTENNVPVFYMSHEHHLPYYKIISQISSVKSFSFLSYVSHKMIFNKRQIQLLHHDIEAKTNMPWVKSIICNYDRNELSGFSEFELYGNFVKKKITRPWKQKTLSYEELSSYTSLCKTFGSAYNSVTFPSYPSCYHAK